MAILTEETLDDKIEFVGECRDLQVRTATIIKRDGVEISRSYSRRVITGEDDPANENAEIKSMLAAAHTVEVRAVIEARKDKREAEFAAEV
tara:strand:- start:789 stop:1061 length:273 start_codon:yes stop_codon:yes gene_type:complete